MITRNDWVNIALNEGGAICFHPEWLKQGCPKCGEKKWFVNGQICKATCQNPKCKWVAITAYPFTEENLKETVIIDKMTVDGV
jgi:hypothetical protein